MKKSKKSNKKIAPTPKHGVHRKFYDKEAESSAPRQVPNDQEDPFSEVNADPDVQVWENPDERTLRDSWDDPEESSNI